MSVHPENACPQSSDEGIHYLMLPFDESRKLHGPPSIALTGFMAAGKSTVGRALAWLLKWRFIDLDCEIECRWGCSIREVFVQQGETRFREIETEALRLVLQDAPTSAVIALGGGTFVQPENAGLVRTLGLRVIFLDLPVDELLRRCQAVDGHIGQNPRPLAQDEEAFCALYARRLPSYRQADLVVNAADKTPEQIAGEIAQLLRLPARAASDF
jgi:shikimate kinase